MIDVAVGRKQMNLFTKEQLQLLAENSQLSVPKDDKIPVAHFSITFKGINYQWLISELDVENPDRAYGLIDTGNKQIRSDFFELKSITDLVGITTRLLNDPRFDTAHTLATFKLVSEKYGRIIADETGLENIFSAESLKLYGL